MVLVETVVWLVREEEREKVGSFILEGIDSGLRIVYCHLGPDRV